MSAEQDIQNEIDNDAVEVVDETTTDEHPELDTIEILQAKLAEAEAKASDSWDKFVRSQAELDNIKKRAQRDLENAHKYGLEKFANELLGVRDSMEMGLNAAKTEGADINTIVEGIEMSLTMFNQAIEKFDIKVLDPLNEKFNPDLHQAMSMQPNADVEANTVLSVMQKGYTLSGRLLRPALVVVSTKA